jgi:cellulose biosynthesis protein BcsQ
LREGIDQIADEYDWVVLDLANQLDNLVHLGMAAVDYLILPVELTADCADRVPMALELIAEARAANPGLRVLGAVPLAAKPLSHLPGRVSAKERLLAQQYAESFFQAGVRLFQTTMYRSAVTVEDARSNFDDRLLHWTARKRFLSLSAEIVSRIQSTSPPPDGTRQRPIEQARAVAAATA